MSSWASGRIHFREKKTRITSTQSPIIVTAAPAPSNFIFSKNLDYVNAVICAIALNKE